jgi:hypothetical protein
MFPTKQHTLICRQEEIAGLERLEEFGRYLYQPAGEELISCAAR